MFNKIWWLCIPFWNNWIQNHIPCTTQNLKRSTEFGHVQIQLIGYKTHIKNKIFPIPFKSTEQVILTYNI